MLYNFARLSSYLDQVPGVTGRVFRLLCCLQLPLQPLLFGLHVLELLLQLDGEGDISLVAAARLLVRQTSSALLVVPVDLV